MVLLQPRKLRCLNRLGRLLSVDVCCNVSSALSYGDHVHSLQVSADICFSHSAAASWTRFECTCRMHQPSCLCRQPCTCCMLSNIICTAQQIVLGKRFRGEPTLCVCCSCSVSAPDEIPFHKCCCNAASAALYLGKGAGIKVPLPCIVSQRPHFSQYRTRKLTPLKELDGIWPSQLVVMIYASEFCMHCPPLAHAGSNSNGIACITL